jgi:FkbM family methyltransferase
MFYSLLKSVAKRTIPEGCRGAIASFRERITGYRVESYSQQGEDIILRILFEGVQRGFYVDVGAYHPFRYSNTYYFYKRGWHGINIDATPGAVKAFNRYRPRDINVEAAIAKGNREITLLIFKEGAVNTLSPELAELQSKQWARRVVSSKVVRTHTLSEILDRYKSPEQEIDFLSVDVEGYDLEVLQSSSWGRHVPKVVLCEDLAVKDWEEVGKSSVYNFLRGEGYALFSMCFHTLIFTHASFQNRR